MALAIAGDAASDVSVKTKPTTDIKLLWPYAEAEDDRKAVRLKRVWYKLQNLEALTSEAEKPTNRTVDLFASWSFGRNYERELAESWQRSFLFAPLLFRFQNDGSIGLRDIHVDLTLKSEKPFYVLADGMAGRARGLLDWPESPEIESLKAGSTWRGSVEIPALQPQRVIEKKSGFKVGSEVSTRIDIDARIYADIISEPLMQSLKIDLDVESVEIDARAFMTQIKNRTLQ